MQDESSKYGLFDLCSTKMTLHYTMPQLKTRTVVRLLHDYCYYDDDHYYYDDYYYDDYYYKAWKGYRRVLRSLEAGTAWEERCAPASHSNSGQPAMKLLHQITSRTFVSTWAATSAPIQSLSTHRLVHYVLGKQSFWDEEFEH